MAQEFPRTTKEDREEALLGLSSGEHWDGDFVKDLAFDVLELEARLAAATSGRD